MTHHGRLGGRGLELLAAFGLIVISVVLLVAAIATPIAIVVVLGWYSTRLAMAALFGGMVAVFVGNLASRAWRVAAALWRPFLRYYRYEPNTLRPLKPEEIDE